MINRLPFVSGSLFEANRFAIFLRSLPSVLFKDFGKVLHIHNPAVQSNRLHLQMGCIQEMHCILDPFFSNIFGHGFPGFFFKDC